MILMAYLRDGRVHSSREAYEGGDGVANYSLTVGIDEDPIIETTINGQHYRSGWCWPLDSKHPYGAVPLLRTNEGKDL